MGGGAALCSQLLFWMRIGLSWTLGLPQLLKLNSDLSDLHFFVFTGLRAEDISAWKRFLVLSQATYSRAIPISHVSLGKLACF